MHYGKLCSQAGVALDKQWDNSLVLLPLKTEAELKEPLEGVVKFFITLPSVSFFFALY